MNEMQRKNETDAAVPIIRTERLTFVYDDSEVETAPGIKTVIPALSDVDLTVRRGEYIAILGHNGSGKSTLAKLLNMILIPTSGRIFIDGRAYLPNPVRSHHTSGVEHPNYLSNGF